jgi:DNA modification methylase
MIEISGALTLLNGDCREVLKSLPDESVNCCVCSPPYFGLRDYGVNGQIGLEPTPATYVANLVVLFREVRRVLRADGTLWMNLGDSYANDGKWGGYTGGKHCKALHCSPIGRNKRYTGLKPKDLIGIPWMVAFALRDDGWYLRSDIIWAKPNPMPESVTDRPTKMHEYLFLMAKSERYFYDGDAVREPYNEASLSRYTYQFQGSTSPGRHQPGNTDERYKEHRDGDPNPAGRNKRSVWTITTAPYKEAHFATYPPDLIKPCILAGCPVGGVVLDPFAGSGTTGMVALELGRRAVLIELNAEYVKQCAQRCAVTQGLPLSC